MKIAWHERKRALQGDRRGLHLIELAGSQLERDLALLSDHELAPGAPDLEVEVEPSDGVAEKFWLLNDLKLSKTKDPNPDKLQGTVLFYNLSPGEPEVRVRVGSTGAHHSKTKVPIRPGAVSLWLAVPTP